MILHHQNLRWCKAATDKKSHGERDAIKNRNSRFHSRMILAALGNVLARKPPEQRSCHLLGGAGTFVRCENICDAVGVHSFPSARPQGRHSWDPPCSLEVSVLSLGAASNIDGGCLSMSFPPPHLRARGGDASKPHEVARHVRVCVSLPCVCGRVRLSHHPRWITVARTTSKALDPGRTTPGRSTPDP